MMVYTVYGIRVSDEGADTDLAVSELYLPNTGIMSKHVKLLHGYYLPNLCDFILRHVVLPRSNAGS